MNESDSDIIFNVSLNWDVSDSSGNVINITSSNAEITYYNEFTDRLIGDSLNNNIFYYHIDSYYVIYSDKSSYSKCKCKCSGLSLCDVLDGSIFTMGELIVF